MSVGGWQLLVEVLRWRTHRLVVLGTIKPRCPLQFEPKLSCAVDCFSQVGRIGPDPSGRVCRSASESASGSKNRPASSRACPLRSWYSANPFRVRWQLETRENPEQRNEFCRSIITRKIEATIITLEKSIPRSAKWERAMKSAYAALSRLEENPPEIISELRALEANCAASYFRSWVGMPIKWRGTSRRPIPDNWRAVGARSSPYHLAGNRNAAHPVNAILNYAYAALESEMRIKAISEGYDPTIGIMHEGSDGSSKFIFDLMEPERPRVDRVVLDFVKGHVFDPSDFVIRTDGVCRLNPEMARMVVARASA
jgi:CRISPR-associated protein Cas1